MEDTRPGGTATPRVSRNNAASGRKHVDQAHPGRNGRRGILCRSRFCRGFQAGEYRVHRAGQSGRRLGLHLPHRRPTDDRREARTRQHAGHQHGGRHRRGRLCQHRVQAQQRPEPHRGDLHRRHHPARPGQVSGRLRRDALGRHARRRRRRRDDQERLEIRRPRFADEGDQGRSDQDRRGRLVGHRRLRPSALPDARTGRGTFPTTR